MMFRKLTGAEVAFNFAAIWTERAHLVLIIKRAFERELPKMPASVCLDIRTGFSVHNTNLNRTFLKFKLFYVCETTINIYNFLWCYGDHRRAVAQVLIQSRSLFTAAVITTLAAGKNYLIVPERGPPVLETPPPYVTWKRRAFIHDRSEQLPFAEIIYLGGVRTAPRRRPARRVNEDYPSSRDHLGAAALDHRAPSSSPSLIFSRTYSPADFTIAPTEPRARYLNSPGLYGAPSK